MDQNDQDDIIKKVKTAGNNDNNQDDNQDDSNDNNDGGSDGDTSSNDFSGDMGGDQGGSDESMGDLNEEEEASLFLENPKKNNMFQPGSNDILGDDLKESEKSSIFDKIKSKLQETFNQEDKTMSEPMIEPAVKPAPVKTPKTAPIAPSRKNKPFLPMPEVQPDPKAIKENKAGYELYNKTLSGTLDNVRNYINKAGFDPIEFDINDVQHVNYGKTERFVKPLSINGKPTRSSINVQIYRMDSGNYELNMYFS